MADEPFDVEIAASASARRLRFDEVPETGVDFEGDADGAESRSARENLPDEVEPGVTYRNARIRWRAGARVRHAASD